MPAPRLTVTVDSKVVCVRVVGCVLESTRPRSSYLLCAPMVLVMVTRGFEMVEPAMRANSRSVTKPWSGAF
jgi:hypothetical protein